MPRFSWFSFALPLSAAAVLPVQNPPVDASARAAEPVEPIAQPANTWRQRSIGPQLGYEGAMAWDSWHGQLIRIKPHNLDGGEQQSEIWSYEPRRDRWELHQPNVQPPGSCRVPQHVFDDAIGRYLRFPGTGGNHGWQWLRELTLNEDSSWNYDPATKTWRNARPVPSPTIGPQHFAAWDGHNGVTVIFGGLGNRQGTLVYDAYANEWTTMAPPDEPPGGAGGNMAYDAARRRFVLFGHDGGNDARTWAYDLRRNRWQDLRPERSPPGKENEAVLAYDSGHQVVVAVVIVRDGIQERGPSYNPDASPRHLETWAFSASGNTWTRMDPPCEPDPGAIRCRILSFAPEHNLFFLDVREQHPSDGSDRPQQQIWSYRYAPSVDGAPPAPPPLVRVATGADSAVVTWQPSPSRDTAKYMIARGTGEKPWLADCRPVATVAAAAQSWRDEGLQPGTIYWYTVRSIGRDGRAGDESTKARTQPYRVEDLTVSVVGPTEVRLEWQSPSLPVQRQGSAVPVPDVTGYVVERARVDVVAESQSSPGAWPKDGHAARGEPPRVMSIQAYGPFVRLTAVPIHDTRFTDRTLDLGRLAAAAEPRFEPRPFRLWKFEHVASSPSRWSVYAYRVRAINALGVGSGPSPAVLTIPSMAQHVFAQETDRACRLKWTPNPEIALRGYRLYRIDGPPQGFAPTATLLTQEPITTTEYVDSEAGTQPHRYYVVAVDTLGQEGLPSSPVWANRKQREFYSGYAGLWHQ